jgi:hypothetical protein
MYESTGQKSVNHNDGLEGIEMVLRNIRRFGDVLSIYNNEDEYLTKKALDELYQSLRHFEYGEIRYDQNSCNKPLAMNLNVITMNSERRITSYMKFLDFYEKCLMAVRESLISKPQDNG